jgi:hypothetical protein
MQGGPAGRSFAEGMQRLREMAATGSQKPLDMANAKYRSVYLPIVRDEVPRALEVFDFAESTMVVGTRESSNTPNQALYLMNNPFVIAQSESLARRVIQSKQSNADRIHEAFLLAFGRPASGGEREAMAAFIQQFEPSPGAADPGVQKFSALCQSLFAAAEFRYID